MENDFNSVQRRIAEARIKEIEQLRRSGKTWTEIGKLFNVSRQRAQTLGTRTVKATT